MTTETGKQQLFYTAAVLEGDICTISGPKTLIFTETVMMVWGSEGAAQTGKLNQTFWHRVCVCELKSDVKVLPLSLGGINPIH